MDNNFKQSNYGSTIINYENLKVFFIKKNIKIDFLTNEEKNICANLSKNKSREFILSRSFARLILSKLFQIEPSLVPLSAPLGKAPYLPDKFGFLSFSHCKDAFVFGWSTEKIGLDIESIHRKIDLNLLSLRILNELEFTNLVNSNVSKKRLKFLELWVIKEALIKRENEKILKNIKDWEWNPETNLAINYKKNINVKVKKINFEDYLIGLANNFLI